MSNTFQMAIGNFTVTTKAKTASATLYLEPRFVWDCVNKLFGGRGGGLLTFGLGDKGAAYECIDSLKLAKNLANLGDVKTLVIHPASTIFHEFSIAQQNKMGVAEDMVRVSVGIENFEDIKADFHQAIAKAVEEKK